MTPAQICQNLLDAGWREYPATMSEGRSFEGPTLDGPNCQCNDKPPKLHAIVIDYALYGLPEDVRCVSFEFFGERPDGRWCKNTLYSVPNDAVMAEIPNLRATASAMWQAFHASGGDK